MQSFVQSGAARIRGNEREMPRETLERIASQLGSLDGDQLQASVVSLNPPSRKVPHNHTDPSAMRKGQMSVESMDSLRAAPLISAPRHSRRHPHSADIGSCCAHFPRQLRSSWYRFSLPPLCCAYTMLNPRDVGCAGHHPGGDAAWG